MAVVAAFLAAALPTSAGAQVAVPTSPILAAPNGYLADAGDPTWKPAGALPSGAGPAWQSWIPPTYASPGPGAKKGDDWVTFELEGARPAPVAVADARATYREVLPGVDASYLSGPAGVSELLVLNGRDAPSRYGFRVKTSKGLSARKAADGSIRFANAAGTERFSFAKPFMFDASGTEDGVSTKVEQGLERVSGGYRVTLTADEAWLRSERRQGPIVLDPTVNLDPAKTACQSPLSTSPTDPNYSSVLYYYLFTPSCGPAREAAPTCRPLSFYFFFPECNPGYVQNVYLPSLITYLTSPLVLGPPPPAQPPPPPPPGRYQVSSCSYTASKVNRAFVPTEGGSYHVVDECASSNPALVHHTNGEISPPHSSNLWAFNAPAGTTLRSADYRVGGERDQRSGIAIYLNTDKGVLEGCAAYEAPPCTFDYRYSAARTGVALGGAAFLRLTTHCGYDSGCGPADTTHRLYGATVELDDLEAPTVTPKGGTLLTQNRQSGTSDVVFDASDNVGIKAARLLIDGQEKARADYPCDYTKTVPCANQANRRLAYDAGLLRDGRHQVRLTTTDASNREASWEKTINVDDAKPTLAAAGTLKDPAGRWVRGGDLHVEARDEASPLEDATGVRAIDVYVDGVRAGGRSQPACASGSCPLSYDFTLPATGFADGTRAVRVTATDFAGNVSEDRVTVRLDRTAPANALSGELTSYAGKWIPSGKDPAALRVAGTDGSSTQPNSGIFSIEVLVDGLRKSIKPEDLTCQGDSCSLTEDFAFRQAEYAEGPRRVSAVVTDKAGNTASRDLDVKVDRAPPALALSGPLSDADGKVVNRGSYALQADARDGDAANPRSGAKSIEILVDGVRKDFATQPCDAGSCPLGRAWTWDTAGYEGGTHTIAVRAEDQVGRVEEKTLRVTVEGIDRAKPTLAVTGTLKDPAARWVKGGDLHVEARDDASPLEDVSGVKSIDVLIDGQRAGGRSQPACASGSCPLAYDFTLPADYPEGHHDVRVVATDFAGNAAEDRFALKLDRTLPAVELSGRLKDAEEMPLTEPSYDLSLQGTDTGSGVRSLEILVDGQRKDFVDQPSAPDGASLSRTWTLAPSAYELGKHTVEVRGTDQADQVVSKTFKVDVAAQTGEIPRYEFDRHELTDKLDLAVNVANGNLVMRGVDYEAQMTEITDLEYPVERYYNSLGTESNASALAKGGWSLGTGSDGRLVKGPTGSVAYTDPSGLRLAFLRQSDGRFRSPPGLDERVTSADGGGLTMTATETGEEQHFNADGLVTQRTDPDGGRIDYAYNDRKQLSSITDSDGRTLRYDYDADGFVSKMVDPDGREHRYEHERLPLGAGRLTAYVSPDGERTEFRYDPISGKLSGVHDASGHQTNIGYDDKGRVKEVVKDPDAVTGLNGQKTTYAYESGVTRSTEPSGRKSAYFHDASGVVNRSESGDSPPDLSLSGTLAAAQNSTLDGGEDYELSADSPGGEQVGLSIDGTEELPAGQDCTSSCGTLSHSFPVSGDALPEGESFIRVKATDAAGDTRTQSMRVDGPPPSVEPIEADPVPDAGSTAPAAARDSSSTAPVPATGTLDDGGTTSPALYTPSTQSGLAFVQAAGAEDPLVLGISSESPDAIDGPFFRDPAISPARAADQGLRVRRVRKGVPWNIAELPNYMAEFRRYRAVVAQQNRELGPGEQPIEIMVVFRYGCENDFRAGDCPQGPSNAKWSPKSNPYSFNGDAKKSYIRMTGRGIVNDRGTADTSDDIRGFMDQLDDDQRNAPEDNLPSINLYTAWNEPNDANQPFRAKKVNRAGRVTSDGLGPDRAALYFKAFNQSNCSASCRPVAGDVIQNGSKAGPGEWVPYFDKYVAGITRRYGKNNLPTTWGLHPYRDLNVLRYKAGTRGATSTVKRRSKREGERFGTKRFIRKVGGSRGNRRNLWFTEVGSRIDPTQNFRGRKPLDNGPAGYSQAEDVKYLLTTLAGTGGNRISRLYYYNLCGGNDAFDAALLTGPPPGCDTARPAYRVFRDATLQPRAR